LNTASNAQHLRNYEGGKIQNLRSQKGKKRTKGASGVLWEIDLAKGWKKPSG